MVKKIALNRSILIPILIVFLGSISLLYRLNTLMPFIGDQGWFYLSARDMLLSGKVPLVGIPSSHPWIHQGALWTYLLAFVFSLFHFNPLAGAYLAVFFGILTISFVYVLGHTLFGRRVALLSMFLYATSPLIIKHARMGYHTTPIPLFTLLFLYAVWCWLKGGKYAFPFVIFCMAMLYNFELATFTLFPVVFFFLVYGLYKKKSYVKNIFTKKILLLSILGFTIPMLPMLLYDIQNGFPQTFKFLLWIGYKILANFWYPEINNQVTQGFSSQFVEMLIQQLLFLQSSFFSLLLFVFAVIYCIKRVFKERKEYVENSAFLLLFSFFVVSAIGYIVTGANSEAYVLIFFPIIIFMLALFFSSFMTSVKMSAVVWVIVIFVGVINVVVLVRNDYFSGTKEGGPRFDHRFSVAKQIVEKAGKKEYTLKGEGPGSEFPSFTMNYEYLTWFLGNPPGNKKNKLFFIVKEEQGKVQLQMQEE